MKLQLRWDDAMLAVGAGLLVVGLGVTIRGAQADKPKTEVVRAPTGTVKGVTQVASKVVIDIAGEVVKPGVYTLMSDQRIGDLLVACGGLSVGADREWVEKNINRAEKLRDGEKIYIPRKKEITNGSITNNQTMPVIQSQKIININTASVEELDRLDGVGPSIAQKIIDYRVEKEGFKNVEEIKMVPGIGDKMYEKIKDEIGI